jgi:hypothetical protein
VNAHGLHNLCRGAKKKGKGEKEKEKENKDREMVSKEKPIRV